MTRDTTMIVLAQVGRAQGLKGEVRATSFTADPLALGRYGPLADASGRSFTVRAIRAVAGSPAQVILSLSGIHDRTAAEALNGALLSVPRAALPDTGDEDEFYHEDLIGLAVRDAAGETVGTVTAVHNFGAGDMLDLRLASGRTASIPFTRAAVPSVDIAAGIVTVDPDAAGLTAQDDAEDAERDGGGAG